MVQRWTKQAKRVPPALLRCTEVSPPTVELGQSRSVDHVGVMSALPPLAVEIMTLGDGRNGPFPDPCAATETRQISGNETRTSLNDVVQKRR